MNSLKLISFVGTALNDLRGFPDDARREAGFQLDKVQHNLEPDDWKPMKTIGAGVNEIRVREEPGAFRVIYVAKFSEAIYVLHCFQKKTQKTSKQDIALATKRYKEVLEEQNK